MGTPSCPIWTIYLPNNARSYYSQDLEEEMDYSHVECSNPTFSDQYDRACYPHRYRSQCSGRWLWELSIYRTGVDCCQSCPCSHRFLDRCRRVIHVHPQRLVAEAVSLLQHIQVLDMDHPICMEHSYGFFGLAREGLEWYLPLRCDWALKRRVCIVHCVTHLFPSGVSDIPKESQDTLREILHIRTGRFEFRRILPLMPGPLVNKPFTRKLSSIPYTCRSAIFGPSL